MAHLFGGRSRVKRGNEHHAKGARGCIRATLKCLEDAGIMMRYNDKRNRCFEEDRPEGDSKLFGRVMTPDGQKGVNHICAEVYKAITEPEL